MGPAGGGTLEECRARRTRALDDEAAQLAGEEERLLRARRCECGADLGHVAAEGARSGSESAR